VEELLKSWQCFVRLMLRHRDPRTGLSTATHRLSSYGSRTWLPRLTCRVTPPRFTGARPLGASLCSANTKKQKPFFV